MTNLILAITLFFANPNFAKKETKTNREVKVLEAKIAKILAAKALSPCEQACKAKLLTATNVCQHVAPANQVACMSAALKKYQICVAACN